MSKPFDYSKWDKIELSDDEEDCHPNIDRESWFRMKHRSRVEREQTEEKDKKKIREEMQETSKRLKTLERDLKKLQLQKKEDEDDGFEDDDEDDLDGTEALKAEIKELKETNAERQEKLDAYEKNKKWNVDNMFEVKEERTLVNPTAGLSYSDTGYLLPKDEELKPKAAATKTAPKTAAAPKPAPKASSDSKPASTSSSSKSPASPAPVPATLPSPPPVEMGVMETYHEFTEKYAEVVEQFMAIPDLEGSRQFLLRYADVILQENASNYLLLASLEDEMNGYREKMKRTARQSQIVSNIAELAKTMRTHPGNVIMPFFNRLEQRQYLEEFLTGCKDFQEKIIKRAVVKKKEMDAAREAEEAEAAEADGQQDLRSVPREERLGPGGLDPLEVIETLPKEMVTAFESRDVGKLREALMKLPPEEAERHMKRCIDSGLWVANA